MRRRRRREPHLPTQLLFRSTGISCSNKKHPSLRRCGRWCCSSCSWCPAHQLQQIAFSADFPSAFMEADYDIYLGAAFNQGNDVFSRNVSYAWKEEEVDAEAAAGDGMEFVVSIVVPIIFGLIVVVGFFGTRLYSPQAGDCSLAKRLWIERKRERETRNSCTRFASLGAGNALVVTVVLFNPLMRSTTNLLIINLAIADLLFIGRAYLLSSVRRLTDCLVVFCVPFTAWDYAFPDWIFGDLWCRVSLRHLTDIPL